MLKKQIALSLLILVSMISFGQENKNSLKVNMAGLPLGLFSLQYERVLSNHFSFNNTFFYRNITGIPFGTTIDSLAKKHGLGITGVDFKYFVINEAKIGMMGYSPELRYYFGSKKNRVFLGLIGQAESYKMIVPAILLAKYKEQLFEIKAPINFNIQAISAGFLIGKQFNFGKRIALDFVIFGPHFGKAANIDANVSDDFLSKFTADEKVFLKEKLIERFGLNLDYYDVQVNDQQASLKTKKQVPFLGIRGFGLNLGYRF
jgi:hypothetical protein